GQHAVLRGRRRALVDRRVARRRLAAAFAPDAIQAVFSHRAVRAGGDDAGRRRRHLALFVPHPLRPAQLCARRARHRPDRLARRSALGDAGDHSFRRLEELRLQHDHLSRRAAEHPGRALRGGAHRWRVDLAPVRFRHAADALAGCHAGRHSDDSRLLSAVCRAVCNDPGRAAAKHRQRAVFHVRGRIQVVEPRFRLGGRVRPVPADLCHYRAAASREKMDRRMRRRVQAPLVNGLLLAAAALTLFPLLWMVSVSTMSPGEASSYPPPLVPERATLGNYRELFGRAGVGRYLVNSVFLAAAVTAVSLVFNVAAGYAFAKLRFAGRDRIFKLLFGALVIPGQVAMVPLFLLLKQMGLVNSYGGVIVPAMAGIFRIFLVRQDALSIPDRLLEAARIDGASEFRIFGAIVVPALKPIIVTLAVFTLLGTWNDFMWPLIVLTDKDLYTLPVALPSLSREHVQDNELMMAGSVLTTLPVLLVFLALQRYYMQGLLAGSVKGGDAPLTLPRAGTGGRAPPRPHSPS